MIAIENPLVLGAALLGLTLGLVIGWLCGITWTARAMLRRDAHIIDQASEGPITTLIARLKETRIRP